MDSDNSPVILADSQLKFWPAHDRLCWVECHNWPIKRWSQALRLGSIRLEGPIHHVALYLEGTRSWNDPPPIKNTLLTLCKTIKNHTNNPKIFVCSHLPRVGCHPVQYPVVQSKLHPPTSCQECGKSYEGGGCSSYPCLNTLSPKRESCYNLKILCFGEGESLTEYGCMVFRECLM